MVLVALVRQPRVEVVLAVQVRPHQSLVLPYPAVAVAAVVVALTLTADLAAQVERAVAVLVSPIREQALLLELQIQVAVGAVCKQQVHL
jgi:hypothetical protein